VKRDLFETFVQMVTGFMLNGLLTMWLLGVNVVEAIGLSAIFFVASFIRQFAVRLIFRRIEG
tara:strand:- start:215 stop:400 length:186 start_codon:yes stop_codon:yes gene_type:complete